MPHTHPVVVSSSPSSDLNFSYSGSDAVSSGSALNSVFPLAAFVHFPPFVMADRVQLCFAGNNSRVLYDNSTSAPANLSWSVKMDDGTVLPILEGLAACTDVKSGQVHAEWTAQLQTPLVPADASHVVSYSNDRLTYLEVVMDYGILQGLVDLAFLGGGDSRVVEEPPDHVTDDRSLTRVHVQVAVEAVEAEIAVGTAQPADRRRRLQIVLPVGGAAFEPQSADERGDPAHADLFLEKPFTFNSIQDALRNINNTTQADISL